jgi:hypothetical protein
MSDVVLETLTVTLLDIICSFATPSHVTEVGRGHTGTETLPLQTAETASRKI